MLWGTHTDDSLTVLTSKSPLLPTPSPSPLPSYHPVSLAPPPSALVSPSLYPRRISLLQVSPRSKPDATDFQAAIVAEYLAHGYVLGDHIVQRAIDFDRKLTWTE
jgi:hypothetical protein